MDQRAKNYDPEAELSDAPSCEYTSGCTDCMADNFDSTAYYNDGSCTYNNSIPIGSYQSNTQIVDSSNNQPSSTSHYTQINFLEYCNFDEVIIYYYAGLRYANGSYVMVKCGINGNTITIPQQTVGNEYDASDPKYQIFPTTGQFNGSSGSINVWYEFEGRRYGGIMRLTR